MNRCGGMLLHPTSLPGAFGIGDFGPEAYRFVDWLADSGCRIWQILPLNPPGYGNSPYACLSAFAGNPLLISLEVLRDENFLTPNEIHSAMLPEGRVDFEAAAFHKNELLHKAYLRFCELFPDNALRNEFTKYRKRERAWLEEWCGFRTLKTIYSGIHWRDWPVTPVTAKKVLAEHGELVEQNAFEQFIFDRQWSALRAYANSKNVQLIGDLPIFVADDSADTWFHRELFMYDSKGNPTQVAGVPPDYFSATGQLWGNPQYDWKVHEAKKFSWWIARIKRALAHTDFIRIDHFRGLSASWHIPAGSANAVTGQWVKAPGRKLLTAIRDALGDIPLIAEDLGMITPDVIAMRDKFGLPGMKILQFAFGDDSTNLFLPHNFDHNCIVYTGTHDNNTTVGWYNNEATEKEKDFLRRYLCVSGDGTAWDLIRCAWRSTADVAIVPVQDVPALGFEHRMNLPGSDNGNWSWRLTTGQLTPGHADGLRELGALYGRIKRSEDDEEKETTANM